VSLAFSPRSGGIICSFSSDSITSRLSCKDPCEGNGRFFNLKKRPTIGTPKILAGYSYPPRAGFISLPWSAHVTPLWPVICFFLGVSESWLRKIYLILYRSPASFQDSRARERQILGGVGEGEGRGLAVHMAQSGWKKSIKVMPYRWFTWLSKMNCKSSMRFSTPWWLQKESLKILNYESFLTKMRPNLQ